LLDASIVDEDVDRSAGAFGCLDEFGESATLGDVEGDWRSSSASLLDSVRGTLDFVRITPDQRYICTGASQPLSHGQSEA
jgi:hypothetical protein